MHEQVNPETREPTEIERLREDYDSFDSNKDGLMEHDEFVRFLEALDAGMSEAECRLGFSEIDTNHDGVIEFDEFCDWWGTP